MKNIETKNAISNILFGFSNGISSSLLSHFSFIGVVMLHFLFRSAHNRKQYSNQCENRLKIFYLSSVYLYYSNRLHLDCIYNIFDFRWFENTVWLYWDICWTEVQKTSKYGERTKIEAKTSKKKTQNQKENKNTVVKQTVQMHSAWQKSDFSFFFFFIYGKYK